MSFHDSPLEAAKAKLPIPALWQILNLPGTPGRECFCPFHENRRTKAASVFEAQGGFLFKCHAGCTDKAVDAPGFLALATGASNEESCRKLIEMAGVMPVSCVESAPKKAVPDKPARPPFRRLDKPTRADLRALADNRKIFINAIQRAAELDHLWFADTAEGRAWIITDSRRMVCQSRRLDGKPWERIGCKAWSSVKEPGGAGWPVGAASIKDCQNVLLCEGGPDFLCGHEADGAAAVAMLGAASRIHAEALPLFAGKCVRILAHGDAAGERAAQIWAEQLREARAARVEIVALSGKRFSDLNEIANLRFEDWQEIKPQQLLTFD